MLRFQLLEVCIIDKARVLVGQTVILVESQSRHSCDLVLFDELLYSTRSEALEPVLIRLPIRE